jgi:holliday junction DNA helicase RuvA
MIAYVRGTLAEKSPTRAVIEAAGVGYELLIPISTYEKLPREGGEAKLLAWHCVREDDELLFGFATANERELFAKLTGVSGVGPKIALAILSGASVGELALAIASGDAKRLAAVKGVGKKTAAKICVELKDKVDALAFAPGGAPGAAATPVAADAVAALRALGFSDETSAKMVTDILAKNAGVESVEQVIKLALASR